MYHIQNNHLRISHSSRTTLGTCKRKFWFRKFYPNSRNKIWSDNIKAELGKALHHGYQTFLVNSDMPMDEREELAIWEYMKKYPIELCANPHNYSSLETGYATLMEMIHTNTMLDYEIAKIKCIDGVERYAIEVPFEIVLEGFELPGGVTVSLTGFIDAIFFNSSIGTYHVLDVKTSGRTAKDGDFSPLYMFNEQCVSYGFVLEYIQQQLIEKFEVIYLHCKVDMKEPKALRYNFYKQQEDIQNWYNGLILDLMNLKTYMEMQWFPRDPTGQSCFAYGNKCEYFDLCGHSDAAIEKLLGPDEETAAAKLAADEATESKTGLEFTPWVKFAIEMPKEMRKL